MCKNVYAWFSGLASINEITLSENVTSIGNSAFENCSGLKTVTLGNSITSIGDWAFYGCDDLRSVTSLNRKPIVIHGISDSGTTFSESTFRNGTLYVPVGTKKDYMSTKGWKDFLKVEETGSSDQTEFNVDNVTYEITGENTVTVKGGDQKGNVEISATIVINAQIYNVTAIAENAFKDNKEITSVTIPEGITTIGNNAFDGCTSLILITIGKDVQIIGNKAFANIAKNAAKTRSDNEGLKVYCETKVLPSTAADAFENSPIDKGTLIVDDELVNVYKLVMPWNGFGSIIGLTTDIRPVDIESEKAFIFDMQGNRLDNVHKGVNIIRTKDGKTKKVVMK